MNKSKKIAITIGDVNGIGPEVTLKALNELISEGVVSKENVILVGSKALFEKVSKNFSIPFDPQIEVVEIPFDLNDLQYGQNTLKAGELAYKSLEKACEMANNNEIKAIATAPLSKEAINLAGYHYSGQTEILEKFLAQNGQDAEMLFVADDLKVLLLTRHLPLNEVSKVITKEKIEKVIKTLNSSLIKNFGIKSPRLAMCGLNPHSGENGLLGNEEIETIIPALNELKKWGIDICGPYPADTLFVKAAKAFVNNEKQPFDCYVACYHDQGLTPIKLLAMNKTVNTTIGLKVLRTSPAHGTAFDIAGQNVADFKSMKHAIINAKG